MSASTTTTAAVARGHFNASQAIRSIPKPSDHINQEIQLPRPPPAAADAGAPAAAIFCGSTAECKRAGTRGTLSLVAR
jgi:hypothetical protein